ncbi:PREDICTED: uncharacterized protein LOC109148026 [Ipomoea nil]|uniref:uncharacterized protein LOC109148026 n=1 Tax=Ipomoea nil TaxID=35883 RepID=UPI000900E5B8|nr:PREDICTED: uncharacterized protein LOC109148026 [Ipomoea nil]XP_019151290.1 PREDICTED: uncharacterized protein LOC109148026 [Ipomoea nil]
MSTSGNEDQNQRNTPVMEDSPSMRIEFLRARLLSERSVSRTAKQRADELTKKVAELEEQLNTVTLQRKKAEKATAAVLAILENHGIGDASDGFDSGSDEDAVMCESNVSDSKDEPKEARDNGGETYSSSEIDSSPSSGRSLSWKSDRESLHSSNRKKYIDSSRRSSSFASTGTSSKHVGKSCRRIRRRETRSTAEESYSKTSMHAARDNSGTTHTQDLLGPADFGTESHRDGLEHHAKSGQLEFPAFQVLENQNCTHEGDGDMEKALQHQAKLIGQYEDEERAQREWEEKYRENTSFMPDSCDLGNHSDVTEERDDMKASEQPSSSKTICSRDQECKPERADRHSSGVQEAPNDFRPPALDKMKSHKTVVSESSSPEFAFPVSKGNSDPVHSENNVSANPSEHASSSSDGSNLQKHDTSGGKYELALISHEKNKNVRNVLEALEQAKVSLRQKLHSIPQIAEAAAPSFPASEIRGRTEIPAGCPALFRLPTDLHRDTTSIPLQFSMVNRSPETVSDMFFPSHFLESRSTSSAGSPFSSIPTNPSIQIGSRNAPWRPMFEPSVNTSLPSSSRSNLFDPQSSAASPFSSNHSFPTYPFSPAMTPQLSSPIGFSSAHSARENNTPPPATRFSLYDDHVRPNMHR